MDSRLAKQIIPQAESRPTALIWVGPGLAVSAAAVLLFACDPAQFRFFPRCAFHQLTGLNCPGCGGQRALHHLFNGEFIHAFHCNVLLVVLLPLGVWVLTRHLARRVFARELPELFKHHGWPWLLAGTVIGFGILRNLPLPAFSWMSP